MIPDLEHPWDARGRAGLRIFSLADGLAKVSQLDVITTVEKDVPRGEVSMGQSQGLKSSRSADDLADPLHLERLASRWCNIPDNVGSGNPRFGRQGKST